MARVRARRRRTGLVTKSRPVRAARRRKSPYDPVTFVSESGTKWRTDVTGAHRPKSWKYDNVYRVSHGKRHYGASEKMSNVVGLAFGAPLFAAALSPALVVGGPHVWAGAGLVVAASEGAAAGLYAKYSAQEKFGNWKAKRTKRSASPILGRPKVSRRRTKPVAVAKGYGTGRYDSAKHPRDWKGRFRRK